MLFQCIGHLEEAGHLYDGLISIENEDGLSWIAELNQSLINLKDLKVIEISYQMLKPNNIF